MVGRERVGEDVFNKTGFGLCVLRTRYIRRIHVQIRVLHDVVAEKAFYKFNRLLRNGIPAKLR